AGGKEVRRNAGASLVDLGDGVLCLEFHAKMNSLDAEIAEMARQAVEETERNWAALLVGNQGEQFSAGANLLMVAMAAQGGQFDRIEAAGRGLQDAFMALRYCRRPGVPTPCGITLAAA